MNILSEKKKAKSHNRRLEHGYEMGTLKEKQNLY